MLAEHKWTATPTRLPMSMKGVMGPYYLQFGAGTFPSEMIECIRSRHEIFAGNGDQAQILTLYPGTAPIPSHCMHDTRQR